MADDSTLRRSATLLTGRGLTPGKLRGLQRISNPNGTLTMLALDQNSSMIEKAKAALKRDPSYDEIVDAKVDLMRQMAPAASGVLIDGYYGAFSCIASGAAPPDKGVLVRVEKSGGPKNKLNAPLVEIESGWSVEKIKLMGADAVKLLAPFEPTEPNSAEHQLHMIQYIADECRRFDILFLLEPVAFAFGAETKTDRSVIERRTDTVVESARILSPFCDVYKAEFPGWIAEHSEAKLREALQGLSEASVKPWVLLSAGVKYPEYLRQVSIAVECGCSGVLGGRAFWQEYFEHDGAAARTQFAATTGKQRVAEVDRLVREKATPWFARYGIKADDLTGVRAAEGWQARYASRGPGSTSSGSSAPVVRPGEVY